MLHRQLGKGEFNADLLKHGHMLLLEPSERELEGVCGLYNRYEKGI